MKPKQVFTILLIFLFCFYGRWLSRGEAENESIAKNLGRVPVNDKKKDSSDNKEKNIFLTPSVQDRSAEPASETKSFPKVKPKVKPKLKLNLRQFIIISG